MMRLQPQFVLLPAFLFFACGDDETGGFDAGPADAATVVDACGETPCTLVPGVPQVELIGAVGDEDPYVFDVAAPDRIIDILATTEDDATTPLQLELALFGPSGEALVNQRSDRAGRGQAVRIQLRAPVAGTYRLVVRDVGGDSVDRFKGYTLTLDLFDDLDVNEPNDTDAAATALTLGVEARGALTTQGDRDEYAFDGTAGRRLEIQLTPPANAGARHRYTLYGPDGEVRAESAQPTGGGAWPLEIRKVGPTGGRFRIVVDAESGGAERGLYTLRVRELAEPDPFEGLGGNDTPADASPLTVGMVAEGYIASTADVDWYGIQIGAASEAQPVILAARVEMPVASPVNLQMTVFNPDGLTLVCERRDGDACRAQRFVRTSSLGASGLTTAHPVTAPGRYLVAVRDFQDNATETTSPYRLSVELPTDRDANETYLSGSRNDAVLVPAATATTGTTITFPWVEGYIAYVNDADWYRFDIPGPVDASPGQNGDWLIRVELEMPSPTPVELNAFFYGPSGSSRERYRGLGQRCREPSPDDRDFCQWPDSENGLSVDFSTTVGASSGDCFVVFREVTGVGPHYWRLTDLDGDDFDPDARYRFRMTISAGCPGNSACAGRFLQNGQDLCGRP